jgi:hypothetical protein
MNLNLHIITLNIPYPPDYGGMIDTFYRIRTLSDLGIRIHLHCFDYGRKHPEELASLCETTNYYQRETNILRQFSTVPYIVSSRKSKRLLNNLIRDDYPILFDALHTTYYINHPSLSGRKKFIRLHNIEHNYYHTLSDNEQNPLKKIYFQFESVKLKRYEKVLGKADYIFPISESDQEYFNRKYHNSVYLPPFHPFFEIRILPGIGEYIIYHGDLSVNENIAVIDSLITNVFSKIPYQCIIAGKDPPEFIISHASRFSNITVIPNPDDDQMTRLVINAQVNLLPALAGNGFKVKLLMALYPGRHCLINSVVGENSFIKSLCHVANTFEEMVNKIHLLMKEPFTEKMILERYKVLSENFDVRNNASKLINLLFGKI